MSSQPPAQNRARHQVSLPSASTALLTPSVSTRPRSPTMIDSSLDGSLTAENQEPLWTGEELTSRRQVISTDMLPDDVLLEIFNSCMYGRLPEEAEKAWRLLVHVCRRWRCIVFGSPRHLNLELVCTVKTRARDRLDVWPAFPLNIWCDFSDSKGRVDNTIAALERTDRVSQILLANVGSSDLELLLARMQQPFPELKWVWLFSRDGNAVIPDSFLSGSAPRLELLALDRILFPGLPKLLLSTTHLVSLHLGNIPHSGYISPDATVTILSTLTGLVSLSLGFESPRSCPDRVSPRPPPSTRAVLLFLSTFMFKGVSEYLEDLALRIDAPQLISSNITFFNDIVFNTPQFIQFINRTSVSRALNEVHITFGDGTAGVKFLSKTSLLGVEISCRGSDWQISSLEQVCTSCSPPLSTLEDLYIYEHPKSQPDWKGNVENGLWVELLHPFTAVKNLYLSEEFASRIAPALQELVEGKAMEVLPTLRNIFLEGLESSGPVQEGIGQFVAARQVASHSIAISRWDSPAEKKRDIF